ncbi:MAG: hypothetical protein ACYC6L_17355 [Anaerolineae bacterium]
MRSYRLLVGLLLCSLVLPLGGCSKIIEQAIGTVASSVPKATEAASSSSDAAPSGKSESLGAVKIKATATAAEITAATQEPTAAPGTKATARPTPAPVSAKSDYLPAGSQILADDFSDPASGFPQDQTDEYAMAYQDGAYNLSINAASLIAWGAANLDISDFVVEVKAEKISGSDDGDFGLIYRFQDDSNFYVFKVVDKGSYSVSALIDNEWYEVLPWTESDYINHGGVNTIAVVAYGDEFSFFINGTLVDSVVDKTFTSGDIALFGSTYNEGGLEVKYSDLKVWEVAAGWTGGAAPGAEITQGEEIYYEDFEDNGTGWDEWQTETSKAGYVDGQYVIEVYDDSAMIWGNAYQVFDDLIIVVEATKTSGSDDNGMGLVLRYQDADNFYVFAISTDGHYTFGYYLDNEWNTVIDWTYSDAIYTGNTTNVLGVAVKGDYFILAINDTVVEEFHDSTLAAGDIGLLGATNSEGNITFAFDNIRVWSVE